MTAPPAAAGARPVRILEVQGTSGYGGSEIHTFQLAQALHADPRCKVLTVVRPGGPITGEFKAAGLAVRELNLDGKLDLHAQQRLFRVARDFQPDLIHTHIRNADWHGGWVARRLGCRWVSTIHDYLNFDREGVRTRGLAARVYRARLRRADGLIAISNDLARDTAAELTLPAARVQVIYNGSAPAPDVPPLSRAELDVPAGAFLVGVVARQTPQKGQDVFIRALGKLEPAVEWRALLVGEGPLRRKLEHVARDLKPAGRVRFLDFRRDVPRLLRTLDLLVVPSRWEAFGRIVTEAMAAGCPVLAARVGGIPELLVEGKSGILFEPGSSDNLARELELLAADPAFRDRLADAARRRWAEQFTVERFQRETLDFLVSTLPLEGGGVGGGAPHPDLPPRGGKEMG